MVQPPAQGEAGAVGGGDDDAGRAGALLAVSHATMSTPMNVAMITIVTRHGASVRLKNSRTSVRVPWDDGSVLIAAA
jgi:hypothetical protein